MIFVYKIRYITTLAIVAFLLHIVWENARAPLYAGYQSFAQHFPICLVGAIGDVVITLLALAFLWMLKIDRVQSAANFAAIAAIGFMVAVLIEQYALLIEKWNYTPAMPLVPWLDVGLLPILQMTLLLPLSFYLTELLTKKS